ncbi:PE-PGRS family protein PE_PGRS17 [Mycobacterium tuberculosis BTB09-001]|uniref:PE domain-containing protein n=1 Tax=Mycobacterium tuberculosis TaxID=1773 RepID=UPI00045AEA24|nr:PE domain-containing protein [Mycobacterium tuberculosis]KCP06956.1 PE-PGRS family protein PE_PGRS17 [Mycobacterium tuberculosis BTB09-001]
MSFVNVAPQLVSTAAADAARIGSAINTANTAAAATTQVLAAAQDEVSTAIAALFGSHGQHYQAISAQVAAYQERFVLALSQAGSTYAVAEAASATPPGGNIYVTNQGSGTVSVINPATNTVTGSIPVGTGAYGVAVNPGGNIYVTNQFSNTVSVINPATNTVTGSPITIGNGPSGVAVSPVTGLVFVTNFDSNTVSVIDPTTNTVTGSPITVGTAPTGVAVNPVTGEVYVTNFAGDTVSVIS